MALILDSHILVWLLYEPDKLSAGCIDLLRTETNRFVSVVSLWELAIKHKAGKLAYDPKDMLENLGRAGIDQLSISNEHLLAYQTIKLAHKDPFDTLLAAQAVCENATLLTADKLLLDSHYKTLDARE